MRIMHISEALGGGIFEVVSNLSASLVDRGHEIAIAYGVRAETPLNLRESLDPRIELIPTPWTARTLRASVHASRALRPIVKSWRPDVIHLHSSFAGVTGAATLRGLAPTVYTPHGYSFTMKASPLRRGIFRTLERQVARHVSVLGAVSDDEARLADQVIRAPRVRTVLNGIPELDPGRIPGAAAEQSRAVVAMGRVAPQRQPEQAAQILAAVRDLAPVAWLGGTTPDSPDLSVLACAGIPVSGWLVRDEALERLTKATVYLHWTAWDGMPLSILEAMAHDVVVIASDISPNRSILGTRQTFSSTNAAIDAIRRVLSDENYRHELLHDQQGRRTQYGSTAMTEGWEEIYESLAMPRAALL
jgi:glycosyltransferase involved in cell wall biosynthesis